MSGIPDFPLGQTIDFKFTTRAFATGIPTTLAGTPVVDIYEDNSLTQITTAETLTVDFDGVTGLNNLRVVATAGNGFGAGQSYAAVITTGTVGGVSVVGEVVAQFTIERSAALAVTGDLDDAAAAGDPSTTETIMQYVKQIVNTLEGTTGIPTYPAAADPANNVSLAEAIRAIRDDVTGLAGAAMRGTDNAALASVVGALTDVAAAGDPTTADTLMQYVKQLINTLEGTAGIPVYPASADPANNVSLAEAIRAIRDDVTGLAGAAMRGTDGAYTGTPPTVVQIADGVWDEDIVAAHGTASTAGLLLRVLGAAISTRANNATLNALLGVADTAGTDLPEQVWAETARILTANTNFNDLDAAGIRAALGMAAADMDTQLGGIQSDTDDIQTRLPAALVSGRMDADVGAIQSGVVTTIANAILPEPNVALSNIVFIFRDSSGTPVTGASGIAGARSIDGAAEAAVSGTIAEISNGMYQFDALAADMNGGKITFRFSATGGTPGAPEDTFVTIVTRSGV